MPWSDDASGSVPSVVVPSSNVIEPVATSSVVVTVAVKVISWPAVEGFAEDVNVVSVAGSVAVGPYSASKHAQLAFSRSMAVELAPRGIMVHTVSPGFVETAGFPQYERFPAALHRLVIDPELVVERLLGAVDKDKREIVVPRWYRPAAWVQALAPGVIASARARTIRRRPRTP